MASSKRDRDADIDRRLRAGRTELDPELSRSIVDRAQSRRPGFHRGLSRVPFGVVGAFSVVLLAAIVAFGGGSAGLDTAGKALRFDNAASAGEASAAVEDQYSKRLTVCIRTRTTFRMPAADARALIASGVATLGPCAHPVYTKNDEDGDGVLKPEDNCLKAYNPDQQNADGDRAGDACDRFPTNAKRS